MNCRVERVVGDILLANGTNMFAWSLSKGRKLYTFHFNNSRAISKDSVYLVDQTDGWFMGREVGKELRTDFRYRRQHRVRLQIM